MELFHGYTYSGHPVACAAGLATLDIYRREGLFTRAVELSEVWADAVHGLKDLSLVTDVRNLGLMAGIDLVPKGGERGYAAMVAAFEAGILVRATGDTLAMSPPLIVSEAQIDQLVTTLRDVISKLD